MADSSKHLLLVEDEAPLREAVAEQLADRGFSVQQADSGEAALARLAEFAFDIIVTDLRLPGIDGSAVVEAAVGRYPDIIAIVVTGYGTVKDAVEAIKRGASDFVNKPFQIDELLHALDSALEQRRLKSENAYLRAQLEERYRFEGVVGKSRAMARLFQLLETVAPTNSTILITGETGTGKEVVARAIHHNSPAAHAPIRRPQLHRHSGNAARGGAVRPRARRVHRRGRQPAGPARAGAQGHALPRRSRDDERRRCRRSCCGCCRSASSSASAIRTRPRSTCASSPRPTATWRGMVADGQFREDLFYRLNVIPVELPPLRERKEDIPLLVQHFLDKFRVEGIASRAGARSRSPSRRTPCGG